MSKEELLVIPDVFGHGRAGSWWWSIYDTDKGDYLYSWRYAYHKQPTYKGPHPKIDDIIEFDDKIFQVKGYYEDDHVKEGFKPRYGYTPWSLFVVDITPITKRKITFKLGCS